ncbi:UPF0481 protein At3g47200-like [Neltuma alba]|uniref:UPF0481 protein At3g47200-like n=1 Tax=Neltuma alba TaxID=207710 RepID=UPI0010A2E760|nr:UPF0481 protein At3g47200-like [Prosopis alba]XP_028787933.1 UPF0481 protein At3g47200-like [Prosopis alba]
MPITTAGNGSIHLIQSLVDPSQHLAPGNKRTRSQSRGAEGISGFALYSWACWDSMESNDHNNVSVSSSPKYEIGKHVIDIKDEPEDLETTKWNIYRVPSSLRGSWKPEAYTPQLVSIGPLHYDQKEEFKPMQKQKRRYLDFFWRRAKNNNIEAMDNFKRFLEDQVKDIRQCYAEKLCDKIDDEKLVDMMLLDSVFIMELFLRIRKQKSGEDRKDDKLIDQTYPNDIILKQSWLSKSIQRDLLLLENQIPMFILKKLYETVFPDIDPCVERPSFIELARDYFDCFHACKKGDCSKQEAGSSNSSQCLFWDNKPQHFTDLIRSFYICKGLIADKKGSPLKTATKLREAGVSFEKVSNRPLLDINFRKLRPLSWFLCLGCIPNFTQFKARLQIPELKIEDSTECVLKNLIAFEQCHYPNQPYICNYVSFIDSLIHTKDDVELLVEKEVIVHELGSDKEVAALVNSLCKHVVTDKTCYTGLIDGLNKHYQRQWNRTMAALRLVYFRDAWRASSTLVATAVLVFTIFNFCRVVKLVLDLEGGRRQP